MNHNIEVGSQTNNEKSNGANKFDEIFLLKGIAIITVVVCHTIAAFNGVGWSPVIKGDYDPFLSFIYSYDAAFFRVYFIISGYLYAASSKQELNIKEYGRYISRKFQRTLVPFLFLTVLNLSGIFGSYSENALPPGGILGHLWYLVVIFIIFLVFPLVEKILKKITSFFLMFAIVTLMFSVYSFISIMPMVDSILNLWRLYLVLTVQYLGIFYFGYFCQKQQLFEKIKASFSYNKILGILLPVLIIIIIINQFINPTNNIEDNPASSNPVSLILIATLTIIYTMVNTCFYWILAQKLQTLRIKMTSLKSLGTHSYPIYLLHQPIIFIFIYYNLDMFLHNPYILSALVSGAGIILPFLFSKFVVKKNKVISVLFGEI